MITSAVGLGISIFLYFLLGAVAAGQQPQDAQIIRSVWLAGLIPFLVGWRSLSTAFSSAGDWSS